MEQQAYGTDARVGLFRGDQGRGPGLTVLAIASVVPVEAGLPAGAVRSFRAVAQEGGLQHLVGVQGAVGVEVKAPRVGQSAFWARLPRRYRGRGHAHVCTARSGGAVGTTCTVADGRAAVGFGRFERSVLVVVCAEDEQHAVARATLGGVLGNDEHGDRFSRITAVERQHQPCSAHAEREHDQQGLRDGRGSTFFGLFCSLLLVLLRAILRLRHASTFDV